ncbi:FAD-dependent monooxygenase [Priestia megaterium]|uniref:FAD-dependent monooxygenase n=1 Tax=Priestia megaterium TaxID=1404 RepID=UPI002040A152|nr:FAD-dependent monooxygenase [Priestia megaterium]MCM3191693.1 FAD-dependent monooxygenase [Priestia megaterium]
MMNPQILIVGAGPTGLVMAYNLARHNIPFRIIDRSNGPGQASRAMAILPRTLEFYQQFGFADEVIDRGIKMEDVYVRVKNKIKAKVHLGSLGEGLSPFPFVLTFPQDDHEQFLLEKLKNLGVEVEWKTELLSLSEEEEGVKTLLKAQQEETAYFKYICGCDGAHSTVRKQMKIEFKGEKYKQHFYVMDVHGSGEVMKDQKISISFSNEEFLICMPVRSKGTYRMIGIIPSALWNQNDVKAENIHDFLQRTFGAEIKSINWFSTYNIHHRVASRFRQGRIFLSGDAAHIHSPAGGQGMNTGIGDAINLSWKLAAVLQHKAALSILDTYEEERLPFAELLVNTTDRAFKRMVARDKTSQFFRKHIFPPVLSFLFRFPYPRHKAFTILSQIRIKYRNSDLSSGQGTNVQSGDRLPYVEGNFESLQSLNWQIHVYGTAAEKLKKSVQEKDFSLHEFSWNPYLKKAGLQKDALYVIRPDGYIGFISSEQRIDLLHQYLNTHKILPFTNEY